MSKSWHKANRYRIFGSLVMLVHLPYPCLPSCRRGFDVLKLFRKTPKNPCPDCGKNIRTGLSYFIYHKQHECTQKPTPTTTEFDLSELYEIAPATQ